MVPAKAAPERRHRAATPRILGIAPGSAWETCTVRCHSWPPSIPQRVQIERLHRSPLKSTASPGMMWFQNSASVIAMAQKLGWSNAVRQVRFWAKPDPPECFPGPDQPSSLIPFRRSNPQARQNCLQSQGRYRQNHCPPDAGLRDQCRWQICLSSRLRPPSVLQSLPDLQPASGA
jgi:hypothetical protein